MRKTSFRAFFLGAAAIGMAGCSVGDVHDQIVETARDLDPRPLSMYDSSGQQVYFNSLRRVPPGGQILAGLSVRTANIGTTTERKVVTIDARDGLRHVQVAHWTAPNNRQAFRPDAQAVTVAALGHGMDWDPTMWGVRPGAQELSGRQVELPGGHLRQIVTWSAFQPPTRGIRLFAPAERPTAPGTFHMHCASARDYLKPTGWMQGLVGNPDGPPGRLFLEAVEGRACVSSERPPYEAEDLLVRALSEMPMLSRSLQLSGR